MPIPPSKGELGDKVAVLVDVADPGNVGTLLRSAAAFGLDVVIAGTQAADPWSPKTVRAGAGAQFRTGVTFCRDLADLGSLLGDRTTVAAVVSGGEDADVYEWQSRTAVLIGSESSGLPRDLVASSTDTVCIRLANQVESLNAGTAGSILFHTLSLA
jgi:TrmH family RNA methyltransferase